MPDPEEYLKGFNIYKGMNIAGYELYSVNLKHNTIKRYSEYSYPIVMIWRQNGNGNMETLIRELERHVSGDKIIYSAYGNPYKCSFGHLEHHYEESGYVVVNSMGYCYRI